MLAAVVLVAVSAHASAECCRNPLTTEVSGTVDGGVYVGGGHGLNVSPYQQTFSVPAGDIKWARLYTGVWASGNSAGWINISYNGVGGCTNHNASVNTDHECVDNTDDCGYYVACGYGNYWYYWNVTNIVEADALNDATVTTEDFDVGDVSGIVLVVVYEDGGESITYWINEGYAYLGTGYDDCDCASAESTTTFSGAIDNSEDVTLWTVYFVGEPYPEVDKLEFNGHDFGAAFGVDDTADGSGMTRDSIWTNDRLDIDKWSIDKTWVNPSSQNDLKYIRDSDSATRAVLAVFLDEPPKPDLMATGIETLVEQDGQTPTALVTNHNYAIDVTTRNIGNLGAGAFDQTFEVGSVLWDTTNFATGLDAGETEVTTYTWSTTTADNYVFKATADSGGAVEESIETNNATTESVTVLADTGPADLVIEDADITFHPEHANHAANNNTRVRVAVRNEGTADAGSAGSKFTVRLATTGGHVDKTTWVKAMSYRYLEFDEVTLGEGPNSVTVTLDYYNDVTSEGSETNNVASPNVNIVSFRIVDTHHYGDDSTYNGPMSGYTDVNMFDVVKLAPEGTDPVELLKSVAISTTSGDSTPIKAVDGLEQDGAMRYYWYPFVNGIPIPWGDWETYPLHEDDLIRWEFLKYVNSPAEDSFKVRPVMDYPEPFVHGYDGTVHNIMIVYPDEPLCYSDKADAIETGLTNAGVSVTISKKKVGDLIAGDKEDNNLILLGTESNNPLIEDVNSQRKELGLPVYFDGSYIIDDSDDTSYIGGVVEACDNPYDGSANWRDAGPSVWLAAAAEDYWAYKAADMLANDPDSLERFWAIKTPDLVSTWDGTNVILDWSDWTGSCTLFNIYITNDLTAGFPMNPNDTATGTTWTDTSAGASDQRYYRVTCSAGGEQIGGDVTKIAYGLENGANWVTIPSVNPPIANARELIDDISNCPTVGRWNPTTQSLETYSVIIPGVLYTGTNFDVKPTRGYETQVSSDTEWGVVGWVPPICPIELETGANWVGMPFNTTIDDARELIDDISNCPTVGRWNPTTQSLETYSVIIPGVLYTGTNFDVKPTRGYETQVSTSTTWTPR